MASRPSTRSGAMNAGEPTIIPLVVRRGSSMAWAMPKSVSFTRPSGATRMFAGLTSRCTIPALCAACSAVSTRSPSCAACAACIGPRWRTRSASDGASTSSITMNVVPPSVTTS